MSEGYRSIDSVAASVKGRTRREREGDGRTDGQIDKRWKSQKSSRPVEEDGAWMEHDPPPPLLPNYRLQLNALDGGREGWMAGGNRRYIAWPATEVVKFHTI